MGFQEAVSICFSKYLGFQGRAARPEYWWWVLFIVIVSVVAQFLGAILPSSIGYLIALLGLLFQLATVLPGLAVSVRRLHDTDRSGWWLLLAFIPILGGLVLLYFMVQPGTPGPNQYDDGASPARI